MYIGARGVGPIHVLIHLEDSKTVNMKKYLAVTRLGLKRKARRPLLDLLEILGPLFGVSG